MLKSDTSPTPGRHVSKWRAQVNDEVKGELGVVAILSSQPMTKSGDKLDERFRPVLESSQVPLLTKTWRWSQF